MAAWSNWLWNYDGKSVDIKGSIDKPYFNGKQIAKILGYADENKAIRDNVDDEDKTTLSEVVSGRVTTYNEGKAIYITETGVYDLIFKSKLSSAKAFKRWVTKEVLPSIRRTGGYER